MAVLRPVVGAPDSKPPGPPLDRLAGVVALELTTIADNEAVLFDGTEVVIGASPFEFEPRSFPRLWITLWTRRGMAPSAWG